MPVQRFRSGTLFFTLMMLSGACCSSVQGASVLPAYGTVAAVADYSWDMDSSDDDNVKLERIYMGNPVNAAASLISNSLDNDYSASARTFLSHNHIYAEIQDIQYPMAGVGAFSAWYDEVTMLGGSGTGVAHFTAQIEGRVKVGEYGGVIGYALFASSANPATSSSADVFPGAWELDDSVVTPITEYTIGISPYNDPDILFSQSMVMPPAGGLDLILTPGTYNLLTTVSGSLTFTYGQSFYLVGGLGAVLSDVLFCAGTQCTPTTDRDGIGTTWLNYLNSAHLVNITVPAGTTAVFSSGTPYAVTSVPETREWVMLAVGLVFVGWQARRRGKAF